MLCPIGVKSNINKNVYRDSFQDKRAQMQYVQCTRALQSQLFSTERRQIKDLFSKKDILDNFNAACRTKPTRRKSSSSSFDLLTEDAVSTTS